MPEIRKHPITREWVIIATERAKRPSDFGTHDVSPVKIKKDMTCPFCPGNEFMIPSPVEVFYGKDSEWRVKSMPNKFPALVHDGNLNRRDIGIYDTMNGIGAHEIVIETPDHSKSIPQMTDSEIISVIEMYCKRYTALKNDKRLKNIQVFKNYGKTAGASLAHPHSQIIATPFNPPEEWADIRGIKEYLNYRKKCPFCHIVEYEMNADERVITDNSSFAAITPYASKFPFEIWIIPKKHSHVFARMDENEVKDFAFILRAVLGKLSSCLSDPPYNYAIHTAPCNDEDRYDFHWHLEIIPRLTIAAGFELGTGVYINVVAPERSAAFLKKASDAGAPVVPA